MNISVEENIVNDVKIGSQKALNIFRIVQEAIHNALKHSNAKNLCINIKSDEKILITVNDDGKGISTTNNDGNGLRNMKTRATDTGIQFTVQSSETGGTEILLETTIN
jgi:signal transduction histidine kinase